MTELENTLRDAPRCVLATSGDGGPLLTPMAFWADGEGLWMSTAASAVDVDALRDDPDCAVYVPALSPGGRGVAVLGSARVHRLGDPVGLLLHAPTISAAMAAMAVKNASTLAGYALDLPRAPLGWLPPSRVVLRVAIDEQWEVGAPEAGPGVAPALPSVVPPDVRRAVAGQRDVILGALLADGVRVGPAVWGSGFRLDAGAPLPAGTRVAAMAGHAEQRPSDVSGLSVHGVVDDAGALVPERVRWWRGFQSDSAPMPAPAPGGITLPD